MRIRATYTPGKVIRVRLVPRESKPEHTPTDLPKRETTAVVDTERCY